MCVCSCVRACVCASMCMYMCVCELMCVCVLNLRDCRDNPLGMGGVMAKRYSELMSDLWSGHSKSITPLKFRVRGA